MLFPHATWKLKILILCLQNQLDTNMNIYKWLIYHGAMFIIVAFWWNVHVCECGLFSNFSHTLLWKLDMYGYVIVFGVFLVYVVVGGFLQSFCIFIEEFNVEFCKPEGCLDILGKWGYWPIYEKRESWYSISAKQVRAVFNRYGK